MPIIEYIEACAAGERSGLFYTCINSYLTAEEVAFILDNSESKVLITSRARQQVALDAVAMCDGVELTLVVDGLDLGDDPAVLDYAGAIAQHPPTPIADPQCPDGCSSCRPKIASAATSRRLRSRCTLRHRVLPTGKLYKRKLRDRYWGDGPSRILG